MRSGVPVIVDAAAELPPRSNLRRFIAEGADLVVFSGGKVDRRTTGERHPGRPRDLIASVALQHQDMDVRPETWSKRWLLTEGTIQGIPHQGFGRAMKVGREEIVGLVTALRRYVAGSDEEDLARWNDQLAHIADGLSGVPGVTLRHVVPNGNRCRNCCWSWTSQRLGIHRLRRRSTRCSNGDPGIAVGQSRAEFGVSTSSRRPRRERDRDRRRPLAASIDRVSGIAPDRTRRRGATHAGPSGLGKESAVAGDAAARAARRHEQPRRRDRAGRLGRTARAALPAGCRYQHPVPSGDPDGRGRSTTCR